MTKRAQYALVLLLTISLFVGGVVVSAESVGQAQVEARRKELEEELDRLEEEIDAQEDILNAQRSVSASFRRDIAILDAEIQKAQLSVQRRDLIIRQLTGEIGTRENTIVDLNERMRREKESLAQLIRKTDQVDDTSIAEIVLGNQGISDLFEDLDAFDDIKSALQDSFREIEGTKVDTQSEKKALEGERSEELQLRELQVLEKQKVEQQEAAKQALLDASQGQEARYQAVIASKQQTAAQIRSELFQLRGSAAIPFGEALDLANRVSEKTGVRPALVLGVIQEETRLGEFLGTGNWRIDMHPTRDQPVFQDIMKRLGLDPDAMPVSAAPSYGWGGAMGPAQFIPSTWILYEDRIAAATGHKPPNPYDPLDAFTASAILLSDNGADRGTFAAERLAALRYFAGWKNAENPAYAFYGDEVMSLATKYQQQIDILARS